MENKGISDPDLQEVSGLLREQAQLCHDLTRTVRETFFKETNRAAQDDTLQMMLKLMSATAASAGAMGRLKSTQIQHTLATVRLSKSESGDSAKTNSSGPA